MDYKRVKTTPVCRKDQEKTVWDSRSQLQFEFRTFRSEHFTQSGLFYLLTSLVVTKVVGVVVYREGVGVRSIGTTNFLGLWPMSDATDAEEMADLGVLLYVQLPVRCWNGETQARQVRRNHN